MYLYLYVVELYVTFEIRGVLCGSGGAKGLLKKGSSGGGGPRLT